MARPRNTTNKFSAICLILLVPVLLLCAFVLSAVGTSRKDWTYRVEYDSDTRECMGLNHRGPFQYCVLEPKATSSTPSPTETATATAIDSEPTETTETTETESASATSTACPLSAEDSRFTQSCIRSTNPGGECFSGNITNFSIDPNTGDTNHFCQQLRISGQLLIAGCALIGIGMFFSFGLAGISLLQLFGKYKAPDDTSSPTLGGVSLVTGIVTGLGFLAMLFGTVLAANDLVNLQFPSGDWYSSGDFANSSSVGPWMIGKSVGIVTAGWVCAAVGASLVGKIWPGPTATYQKLDQQEIGVQAVRGGGKNSSVEE